MHKKILTLLFALALWLPVFTLPEVQAERATREEMEVVCQNWLSYMVYQRGAWAGDAHPRIVDVNEIVENDTVLGRCFSISPRGFVVVPLLKELPPIKAYSEKYRLDMHEDGGFARLLRDVLFDRVRLFSRVYGSLDAVQPPTGDVLLGHGHRTEWERFLKSEQEFETDLAQGKFDPLTEEGPLLTTSWHQYDPYNDWCPTGDQNCIICPNGKPPSFPCKVGCVAVATAQILKYWNWPPSGTGTHSYWWGGDYSCDGSTPGGWLDADYSDPYDWESMPDNCDLGCTPEESAALAELCYEVGVAFEMNYGVCGSGAYTSDALTVFPTYFRYDPSINIEYRYDHTAAEWFSIIQDEINHGRPMQYRIDSHSIVCDGWRDTGGLNQYHMNYGWGDAFTAWYSIDSLYCYWILPDSLCPPEEEFLIKNIMPLPLDSIPFAPAANYGAGDGPWSVFCADLDGDGDLDLAVANYGGDNVSILKNNGDATFQTKVDYGAGDGPRFVFCADLDGDGDLDLAVANDDDNNISILKNNGDGTFASTVNYGAGHGPRSVFCADLDGDDDLDLAVANDDDNSISILKNNGDGTFASAVDYGTGDGPWSVFCADLDGDFDLDLAVANSSGGNVSILKNSGNGTFQTKVDYGAGRWSYSLFCTDLDGDLDLDLAVASGYTDSVSILKNNGNGTFQTKVDYGAGHSPWSAFCADLNGDTDLDLATANIVNNNVSILKNNGNGTFQTKVDYGAGACPLSVFCADLDGDLDLDLAVANWESQNISILKNLSQIPANQPPDPFSLLSPTDGESVCSPLTLDWQTPYDPNFGDQIRYDFYLSTVANFDPDSTTIYDSLVISRLTTNLDIRMYYYWKVRAYDNWGAERWSNQNWSFYVSLRGDANGDGMINIADVVYLLNYLFTGGLPPDPLEAGDVTCDGLVNIADVVYLLNYLFTGGPPPGCSTE